MEYVYINTLPHSFCIPSNKVPLAAGSFNSTELLDKMRGFGYVLHHPWSNKTRPVTEARQAIDTDKNTWAVFDNLVMVHSSFLGAL